MNDAQESVEGPPRQGASAEAFPAWRAGRGASAARRGPQCPAIIMPIVILPVALGASWLPLSVRVPFDSCAPRTAKFAPATEAVTGPLFGLSVGQHCARRGTEATDRDLVGRGIDEGRRPVSIGMRAALSNAPGSTRQPFRSKRYTPRALGTGKSLCATGGGRYSDRRSVRSRSLPHYSLFHARQIAAVQEKSSPPLPAPSSGLNAS
jgi:hypothetical protein